MLPLSGLWQDVDEKPVLAARGAITPTVARNGVVPVAYRTLTLNRDALKTLLTGAIYESDLGAARAAAAPAEELPPAVEIDLPIPNCVHRLHDLQGGTTPLSGP